MKAKYSAIRNLKAGLGLVVARWPESDLQRIEYLEPISTGKSDEEAAAMTAAEVAALKQLAENPLERRKFWAMFWADYAIHAWGFKVYQYMHKCPQPCAACSEREKQKGQNKATKSCPFVGRHMIELAGGKCEMFLRELEQLMLQGFSDTARKALLDLQELDAAQANLVEAGFDLAKRKVHLRFQQATSFYTHFPWSLCKLLGYIKKPAGADRDAARARSREFALELLVAWDGGHLPTKTFASKFFELPLLDDLKDWAHGGVGACAMRLRLFKELLSYSLSLVVMQRLESRHHLVNQRLTPSRASSAAAISASLRRRLNPDSRTESFRLHLEKYLQEFDTLVPEQWNSMAELHRLVSGHNLQLMFQSTEKDVRFVLGTV